jgi:hypothetical protein
MNSLEQPIRLEALVSPDLGTIDLGDNKMFREKHLDTQILAGRDEQP